MNTRSDQRSSVGGKHRLTCAIPDTRRTIVLTDRHKDIVVVVVVVVVVGAAAAAAAAAANEQVNKGLNVINN